jgi:hypothetical protein
MRYDYATVATADLAVLAATDPSAHEAYETRCATTDAILHLLHLNVWDEVQPSATYVDPESTGPIATADILALLAPVEW